MQTTEIKQTLITRFLHSFPPEGSEILNTASSSDILICIKKQAIGIAREVFLNLSRDVAKNVVMDMDDSYFVELFSGMDSYQAMHILSALDKSQTEQKLRLLPSNFSLEIKEIMTYPADSAGFLMDTQFLSFYLENTIKDVLKKLRLLKDRKIRSIFVIDKEGHLAGKIPIHVVAISQQKELLKDLVEKSKSVHVMSPRDEIVDIFKEHNLINLPVVDLDNKILGIIRHDVVVEASQQNANEDVQAMFGAGREERALSKVSFAVKKRLPWLQINLATAFLAAAVVGIFEDTIARITVLAVFLPVVAGQSGNTGSQALAVVLRGLALREVRPSQWLRIARKEAAVGLFNGVAVAFTTSIIVYLWASSFGLALIIAVSMVFSMVIAGFSGAVIPIFLKSIGQDPAQSSSIVLTTVTDIVGFMSFLGLATALGSMLGVF